MPIWGTLDILALGIPLGQSIGRIGCFMAGCCYGSPTSWPWGVSFSDPQSLVDRKLLGITIHPTQIIESAGNIVLFAVLHRLLKLRPFKRNGAVFLVYCAAYSALRFGGEFLRGDDRGAAFFGLSFSQCASAALFLAVLILWKFLPVGGKETHD